LRGGGVLQYNDYNDMETIKLTRVIKTGTSLCVVIPKNILHALHIQRGDNVVLRAVSEDTIILHKISDEEILKLKTLPGINL